ncbi:MAG: hypothetical protein ABSA91_04305 [Acidimicrobiales bacterium]
MVRYEGRTVPEVAGELAYDWHTLNDAVAGEVVTYRPISRRVQTAPQRGTPP